LYRWIFLKKALKVKCGLSYTKMKVVVGHKVLNLEELYNVSMLGSQLGVEVIVDS